MIRSLDPIYVALDVMLLCLRKNATEADRSKRELDRSSRGPRMSKFLGIAQWPCLRAWKR